MLGTEGSGLSDEEIEAIRFQTDAWGHARLENLVAQICPKWNHLQPWFELVGAFKDAA